MTITDTVADEYYRDRPRLAMEFARLINDEARELEALGVDVIQLDEPAFNVYLDDVADWGIDALHQALEGIRCLTAVHICYGYGIKANTAWKGTLGQEWRQYERTFPLLAKSRIDQVSVECAGSRVPMPLLELLQGKDVLLGVIDVATNEIETPGEVAETIRDALAYVPADRIIPCTNCGMVPLTRARNRAGRSRRAPASPRRAPVAPEQPAAARRPRAPLGTSRSARARGSYARIAGGRRRGARRPCVPCRLRGLGSVALRLT